MDHIYYASNEYLGSNGRRILGVKNQNSMIHQNGHNYTVTAAAAMDMATPSFMSPSVFSTTREPGELTPTPLKNLFRERQAAAEASVKVAMDKICEDPELIGDASQKAILPYLNETESLQRDLKEITPGTLVDVIMGKYHRSISSYTVVDCRYPYEYEGGHICGALNLFTEKKVWDEFLLARKELNRVERSLDPRKRKILVFHCEFSAQRGPKMCRRIRSWDRNLNTDSYPNLYYPEIYILNGGFKRFFNEYPMACVGDYVEMEDNSFKNEYLISRAIIRAEKMGKDFGKPGAVAEGKQRESRRQLRKRKSSCSSSSAIYQEQR